MAKVKKQNKTQQLQRRKEEAMKAQNNVRGFSVAPLSSIPSNGVTNKVATSATSKTPEVVNTKFALPIEQIKQDLVKTEVFVVIAIAAIVWLQRTQFLMDKVSALVHL